jgi:hypothetical protein
LLAIKALTGEGDLSAYLVVPWIAGVILSLAHAAYWE